MLSINFHGLYVLYDRALFVITNCMQFACIGLPCIWPGLTYIAAPKLGY